MTSTSCIKILGNSGADIKVFHSDRSNKLILEKTVGLQAKKRFLSQIEKQKRFTHEKIKTPEIYEVVESLEAITAKMDYVVARDFITYTNLATKDDYIQSINNIVDFIVNEFKTSTLEEFPQARWLRKVEDVISQIKTKHNRKVGDRVLSSLTTNLPKEILIGKCHGDLTFSNIMVDRFNQIYFIDFLDPPIETPYEDVAKFLQDAEIFWSLLKYQGVFDATKIKIYWTYASKELMARLPSDVNRNTLNKIQILSLLRIVPYVEDNFIVDFLLEAIEGKVCC